MKLTDIVHRWQETHVLHLPSFLQGKGSHGKPNLSTDSISLARNRIQTSKCTRENSGLSGGSEELHVVLPRYGLLWRTAAAAAPDCEWPALRSTVLACPCSWL
jgi:hypothetical protein